MAENECMKIKVSEKVMLIMTLKFYIEDIDIVLYSNKNFIKILRNLNISILLYLQTAHHNH